ncbi:MAG TPA: hypothetical protein VFD04_23580 [Actinomycetes bacterium]|nr:hypothetical protein [Actinomycetes bacterium]
MFQIEETVSCPPLWVGTVILAPSLGYPPRATDRQDVRRLHERLGAELPPVYR